MPERSSRRRFLATGTAFACNALLAAPCARAVVPTDRFTASGFAAEIGTVFAARPLSDAAHGGAALRLAEVSALPSASGAAGKSFVAVFDVDGDALAQDTYALEHRRLGAFAALLVPNRDGRRLIAVYDRA